MEPLRFFRVSAFVVVVYLAMFFYQMKVASCILFKPKNVFSPPKTTSIFPLGALSRQDAYNKPEMTPDSRPRIVFTASHLEEVLDSDGVQLTQQRFQEMNRIFSTMNATDLEGLARSYPLLLALESSQLARAKSEIEINIPYVDIKYIFEQKAAGLEFFVNCATSEFDFKAQVKFLKEMIGTKNQSELEVFIRRVPHALGLRYQVVLSNHIKILENRYDMDKANIRKVVMRWPRILNVVNLNLALDKLEVNLKRAHLPVNKAYLRKLICKIPRVIVQDVHKKIDTLSRTFPDWNIKDVLVDNPRIISQKTKVLETRYQVSMNSIHGV